MKNKYIIIPALLISITGCKAQSNLQTKEVFMYKNGYAYVHKSGTVNLKNGQYFISEKDIPNMLFGSVWMQSPQKIAIVSRFIDTVENKLYEPSVEQMLRQSLDKTVKLSIVVPNGMEQISGKVVKIFETPLSVNPQRTENSAIAAIETASGTVIINRSTLSQVLFATIENAANTNFTSKVTEPGLSILFGTKNATADLDLVYLERHLSWMPSYRLKLNGDKKATLALNAEVNSGSVELTNAQLNLVAASPEVFEGGIPSRLVGGYEQYQYNSDMYGEGDGYAVENRAAAKVSDGVETGSGEDYYIYAIKNVTLQKDQAALLNILEEDIDVNHVYLCQLYGNNEYSTPEGFGNPVTYPVNHAIEFTNPSKQPLTAAPVFVETSASIGGNLLLGQPRMASVPIGGKTQLYIAQSLDIPVTQTESEKSRISNDRTEKSGEGYIQYDKVTIDAALHFENQGDKEVTLKLNRYIQGKPLATDLPWAVKVLPATYSSPNSNNEVTWTVKLKPGEKKDIKYSYEYFLRMY